MNSNVQLQLRNLYKSQGEKVFKDQRVLKAYIMDILSSYPSETAKLCTAVDEGIAENIINEINPAQNLSRAHVYADQLVNMRGMSRDVANDIVETLIYAIYEKKIKIGGTTRNSSSSTKTSRNNTDAYTSNGTAKRQSNGTPSFVNSQITGNTHYEPIKAGTSKGKIIACCCAVIAAIGVISGICSFNPSEKDTNSNTDVRSNETMNQEPEYVVDTRLNSLSYLKKDDGVTVGNSNVSSNIGTSYEGYIKSDFPYSDITYAINGNYDVFQAVWAISDSKKNTDEYSSFEILADGKSVYSSPRITSGDTPVDVNVNLDYCDSITIVFKEGDGEAFIGGPVLSSSQSERTYSNATSGPIRTSKWLTELDEMTNEKMIIWKDTWIKTNTGTCLVNPINPYVPSYSNIDIESFAQNGSYVDYYLGGEYTEVSGTCAIDEKNKTVKGNMKIQLIADDKIVYTSPSMSKDSYPADFNIDISGCQKLSIKFIPSGNGNWGYDAAGFNIGNLKIYR